MYPSFLITREKNNSIVCGRSRSPSFYPHFHSNIEIQLILSGQVEVLVNDRKKLLGAGEVSVALSYDAHGYRTPEAAEAMILIIPVGFCQEILPLLSDRQLPSPFIGDPAFFKTVLDCMEGLAAGGNGITRRGLLYTLLGAVYDKTEPKGEGAASAQRGFSAEMLIYINEHFREELRLTDVAREFGYNPGYLSRSFRQTFGIPFLRYLTMLRLRESVLLLRSGRRTVTECAVDSGFGSMRSFYRAFFDEYGCSPRKFFESGGK